MITESYNYVVCCALPHQEGLWSVLRTLKKATSYRRTLSFYKMAPSPSGLVCTRVTKVSAIYGTKVHLVC